MQFIERKNIDLKKWNERISADSDVNVFCYAWYLDAVAENWGALISDNDYTTVLPIAYTSKIGVKQMYQAPFTREYTIFGTDFNWQKAIDFLLPRFKLLAFRNESETILTEKTIRHNQYLTLTDTFTENYRSNAKRLVKKAAKNFVFEPHNNPAFLIQLFNKTVGHKIDSIGDKELKALEKLMQAAISNQKGEMLIAKNQNEEIIAGGYFLKDKNRITYLKGAATTEAKKLGAMYGLFDFAFTTYKKQGFEIFDFGGSEIENVATFYKKFGAVDRNYYNYTIDNTPLWFKTLKKLKG